MDSVKKHNAHAVQTFSYPAMSGVFFALAIAVSPLWFFSFFALVPFLLFLYEQGRSFTGMFRGGLVFGTLYFGTVLLWFWGAHPLTWVGVSNTTVSFFATLFAWGGSVLVLAAVVSIWTIVQRLFIKNRFLTDALTGASLWVLFEYLRAFAISIFWSGPSSFFGTHWTFGSVGYVLAENNFLLSLSSIGGVYLLSFVVIFANFICFWLYTRKRLSAGEIFCGALIIALILSAAVWRSLEMRTTREGVPVHMSIVTTNFDSAFRVNPTEILLHTNTVLRMLAADIAAQTLKTKNNGVADSAAATIVVFPEHTALFPRLHKDAREKLSRALLGDQNGIIIDSSGVDEGKNELRSSLFYYDNSGTIVARHDKILIAPYGEFVPYTVSLPARITGGNKWLSSFNGERNYTPGNEPAVASFDNLRIGSLFCSEILSDKLYRSLAKNGASILINTASYSFARNSDLIYKQIVRIAKVRAVENDRYFIQATNGTSSFVIDNTGDIIAQSKQNVFSIMHASAYPRESVSPYVRFGNWILPFAFLIVLCAAFFRPTLPLTRTAKTLFHSVSMRKKKSDHS